jgi:hypothetical protein
MPITSLTTESFNFYNMNSIDTRIAIGGIAANFGATAKSEPHPGKLLVKDTSAKSSPGHTQSSPVKTDISYSTYGHHNERISIVVKNQETGEVIREIPSKEMQKLHINLDLVV